MSRASPEIRICGGRTKAALERPRIMGSTPKARHQLRQRQSQQIPKAKTMSPQAGMGIAACVAPGQAATMRATHKTPSTPSPMTQSAGASSPSGISKAASMPAGMTMKEVSGTAIAFAATPYHCSRPKCARPKGAVAAPASTEVIINPSTANPMRHAQPLWPRSPARRGCNASHPAIRASTAAKDIWKDGPRSEAGSKIITTAAAQARPRSDMALRPARIASVTRQAMAKLRCMGTCAPVSSI